MQQYRCPCSLQVPCQCVQSENASDCRPCLPLDRLHCGTALTGRGLEPMHRVHFSPTIGGLLYTWCNFRNANNCGISPLPYSGWAARNGAESGEKVRAGWEGGGLKRGTCSLAVVYARRGDWGGCIKQLQCILQQNYALLHRLELQAAAPFILWSCGSSGFDAV